MCPKVVVAFNESMIGRGRSSIVSLLGLPLAETAHRGRGRRSFAGWTPSTPEQRVGKLTPDHGISRIILRLGFRDNGYGDQ
jgi:hypothetical protein